MTQPFSKTKNLRIIPTDVGSEVFPGVARESSIYWNITTCSPVKVN
jgi:hypothetical protein